MKATIVLDEETDKELKELSSLEKSSKSELIREAIKDRYIRAKRAKEGILFYVDLYSKGLVNEDLLYTLLPRKDAEAVIIGTKTGKEAARIVKGISS